MVGPPGGNDETTKRVKPFTQTLYTCIYTLQVASALQVIRTYLAYVLSDKWLPVGEEPPLLRRFSSFIYSIKRSENGVLSKIIPPTSRKFPAVFEYLAYLRSSMFLSRGAKPQSACKKPNCSVRTARNSGILG